MNECRRKILCGHFDFCSDAIEDVPEIRNCCDMREKRYTSKKCALYQVHQDEMNDCQYKYESENVNVDKDIAMAVYEMITAYLSAKYPNGKPG